ncbi:calcium-binding protein [Tropicimonas isoalkanivorans]|uniref:EF hand n=1 Tax=Tropicimonas isoalkanivorans TaxID=441112 RepID=A0A1I1MWH1_9RHOB|nr:calcium-binding protein [Tropicimonas isoalkanivorans]SFC86923.1 EF hand [Tropicimonas isoalkanivorans]
MKRSGKRAVALAAIAAIGAAITIPALAHGPQGGGWMQGQYGGPGAMMGSGAGEMMDGWQGGPGTMHGPGGRAGMGPGAMGPAMMGDPEVMEHMMEMHSQMGGFGGPVMMGGAPGMGMMGGSFGPGIVGGPGGVGMMGAFLGDLDADRDGSVTSDEARDGLQAALADNDSDGSGTLSLGEFEALHNNTIRPMMVDRFQALDADGDGQVTQAEITAPADWIARIQAHRATLWQDCPGLQDDSDAAEPEEQN